MYPDYEFDLPAFIEKMKQQKTALAVCTAVDDEIRRVDALCYRKKGAVAARKKGIPYRESLRRLYLVMRTGNLHSYLPATERQLFGSLLESFS